MKRGRFVVSACILGLLVSALSHSKVWALTDEQVFREFRFNFVNPGARSLGMGGAFIAAGDDATAAESNPAALQYVNYTQFFAEVRQTNPDTLLFSPNHGTGSLDPSGAGLPFLEFQATSNKDNLTLPSFASFVYPFGIGGHKARIAVSRHVVLDEQSSLRDGKNNTFLRFSVAGYPVWVNPQNSQVESYAVRNTVDGNLDTELVHYNAAFSYSLTDDFSIGVTATYAHLSMDSAINNVTQDPRGVLFTFNPRVIGPSGQAADIQTQSRIKNQTDAGFTYTIGIHWHPDLAFPNRSGVSPIRFGFVYRKGADLSVQEETTELDPNNRFVTTSAFTNSLRVPDRFGLGVSYQAGNNWIFSVDVERIQYSDLLKNFQPGVNFFTSKSLITSLDPNNSSKFEFNVDDATVVHAGVEYSFNTEANWAFAFRAGYYNAPDNRIRMTRADITTSDPVLDSELEKLYKDVFSGGDNQNHYTAGFSIQSEKSVRIQFAADFSDTSDQFLASMIYQFGPPR